MDLILWRHAQAHELPPEGEFPADPSGAEPGPKTLHAMDLARRLTPKGERQAERMAKWLNQRLPESTIVLASPAQRTQQTVQALGRPFKTVTALQPHATPDALLKAARWPNAKAPVLIVGHQPTLGLLAARLMTGQDLPWSLRKGGVWWFRSREGETGELEVALLAVQSPDLL